MPKLALHARIIIGMILGFALGFVAVKIHQEKVILDWVKPFGTIFLNALKLVAVPVILTSIITGLAGFTDIKKVSRMGLKTLLLYMSTTVLAVSIGLVLVNITKPGDRISDEMKEKNKLEYAEKTAAQIDRGEKLNENSGPLQFLVDMVPDNIFLAASDNTAMLKVIVFAIFFGFTMILVPQEVNKPVLDFFSSLNTIIIKMMELVMLFAPLGVGALIAGVVVDYAQNLVELMKALGVFFATVAVGLLIMIFGVYFIYLKLFGGISYKKFYKKMMPVKLLAFSTSSSVATLPLTMEKVEEMGVSKEVSGFVLPLGATINMDGTSLYLGVSALFIAQAFGMDLTFAEQAMVVLTCTLASIGTAAIPSGSIIMLFVILKQADIPVEGMALIFPTDRLLDMLRTSVNVTGDGMVAAVVAKSEGKLDENAC